MLAAESQHVIALRMMKFAGGGHDAHLEAHRMVAEKFVAVVSQTTVPSGLTVRMLLPAGHTPATRDWIAAVSTARP